MKSFIEYLQYKKCVFLLILGMICSISAFIIYVINPVKIVVQSKLQMAPGSLTFNIWKKPSFEVFFNVYIFNITNAESFMNGEEKLKVQEIGPYVYQEFLENENVTWNENGTISYVPKRTLIFRPDLSVGRPEDDYVTVPNIPMLGTSSALSSSGFLINYSFMEFANALNSEPILNITAYDFLWGYEDALVRLAGTVVPNFINFKKFGLLDRIYDEGKNLFNLNIKLNNDMVDEDGRYLSIQSMNGSPGLSEWGYLSVEQNETRPENSKCNEVQGATEGVLFPYNLDKKAVFRVYRRAFCRPLTLVFVKEVYKCGLPGYQYTFADDIADPPELNPDNKCYCRNGECLKKGLMDLTPCYYKIPAASSLPHFMNSDPSLLNSVDGLNPDPEKHGSVIILQPNIGIPMYVRSRLQTNLVMKEGWYNSKIKSFNGLVIPLFWTDFEVPSLPDDLSLLVKLAVTIMPTVQMFLVIFLGIGGAACICWSLVHLLVVVQKGREALDTEKQENSDLRLPLSYEQYPSIRILPTIKKITSRTDLFT